MRTGIGTALIAAWVVLLLVGSLSPASAHPSPSLPARSTAGLPLVVPSASPHWCATVPTFSPVVIPSGNTTYWNGSGRESTCFQQGSVTIENGGTLIIQNVTLSMVQFVAVSGTLAERLSNISRVVDAGTMVLRSAVITTDANVTNPYLKLNFTVTGDLSLWNSSLAFPGWFNVETGADVVLNDSTIAKAPHSLGSDLSPAILGDVAYSPSVSVLEGSHLTILGSRITNVYADNTSKNGLPGILPVFDSQAFNITSSQGKNLTGFQTPSNSTSLIQDWLYPDSVLSGELSITYNSTVGLQVTPTIDLNGTLFQLSTAIGGGSSTWITAIARLPGSFVTAVNKIGIAQYLEDTGSFGVGPSRVSVNLSPNLRGSAEIRDVSILLNPPLDYNLGVSGTGARLELVDSEVGLNWAPLPVSPVSQVSPYPWNSNKLIGTDGATLLLANLTVPAVLPRTGVTSAILTDSSSTTYSYRWAEFSVEGPGGWIPGARVDAFSTGQGPENATVTALNDLAKTPPAMWGYVQWWDAEMGLPAYG